LRKRGYQPEAFEKMIVQRGMSEVDKVISQRDFFKVLNNFNREVLRSKTKKADFEKTDEKKYCDPELPKYWQPGCIERGAEPKTETPAFEIARKKITGRHA